MADLPEIVPLTTSAIWSGWEREQDRSRRTYVGASVLGDECERKLWYSFRWAHEPEVFDGRKLRLFNTGHVEEDRLIADLRRAGIDVLDMNELCDECRAEMERQLILATLDSVKGHKEKAAELLGISAKTLYNRLREYGREVAEAPTQ